jgi:uncharacterized phosphosugar-binding protein
VAPRRAGSTLAENGSVVLDTLVPPGDATYPPDSPVVAPVSTVVNAFLWNLVLVRLIELSAAEGVAVPLWRSSNVPDGDAANAALLAKYTPRIPALG